ncbi:MAG: MFS transporter, partial [Kiritimatiellae bacterium]|nr:MFS transporter [Kiritimatiellia bacterium]
MGKSYKWLLLVFLSMAFFFHQADRVLFGLLTIPIQEDLHLTDLQIGWINTALFCTLAVMTPVGGFVGDRFSRKWIITFSLLFWSLMTACTGLVGGMCGLIFFRSIATGGGESFYVPSALALLATHHKETRSVALSVHQAALYTGLMFSGALVAWALKAFGGWRPVFFTFGGLGFALGVVFVFCLKEGRDARPARPQAKSADGNGGHAGRVTLPGGFSAGLRAYFCNPSALLATGGFVAVVFANNAYLSWAPKFMARKFGLGVGAAGYGTMFYHHVAAFVAIMAGAFLTDACVRRNPRFRLLLQSVSLLLGAPALILFGIAPSCIAAWAGV